MLTKQKCSDNNLELVTALKERIDSMKQQFQDKHFIIESLLAKLQHRPSNSSANSGNQNFGKKRK